VRRSPRRFSVEAKGIGSGRGWSVWSGFPSRVYLMSFVFFLFSVRSLDCNALPFSTTHHADLFCTIIDFWSS
jgi:hypothetical protein